jgi:uncharacterized membrane-anchored protein
MVNSDMNAMAQDNKAAVREALEAVARELEARAGNALYRAAWKVAAKIVRSRKPAD